MFLEPDAEDLAERHNQPQQPHEVVGVATYGRGG